jgi:carboxypeptidase C (cathepsin A)
MLGFISEIGPYVWEDGATNFTQTLNKFSWNQNASLLFFESPPGVGFSENNLDGYVWSDSNTTENNYNALLEWFKLFPEYANNDFWISGESYAGIYIPWLANEIDQKNNKTNKTININLKGKLIYYDKILFQ